jgi:hypothetical protein
MESLATLGANAAVRENRTVVSGDTVGMGAAVVRDIDGPLYGFWGGVPAKPISRRIVSDDGHRIRWCVRKLFSMDRYAQFLHRSLVKGHLTNDGPLQSVLHAKVKNVIRSNRDVLLDANKQTKTTLWIAQYPIQFFSTTTILPENVDQRFTQESRTKITNTTDNQRH